MSEAERVLLLLSTLTAVFGIAVLCYSMWLALKQKPEEDIDDVLTPLDKRLLEWEKRYHFRREVPGNEDIDDPED